MCKAYSKPKKRLDVPTMRKHVRQKMPDCLAIAWLQHDTWLWRQHHIQFVISAVSHCASHQTLPTAISAASTNGQLMMANYSWYENSNTRILQYNKIEFPSMCATAQLCQVKYTTGVLKFLRVSLNMEQFWEWIRPGRWTQESAFLPGQTPWTFSHTSPSHF